MLEVMETKSFIGLPYCKVKKLMMKSCEYIDELSVLLIEDINGNINDREKHYFAR